MSDLKQAFGGRTANLPDNDASPTRLVEYFRPRGRTKLVREHAVAIVHDAIVAGRLRPGTRLVERELCEALEVSRTVVREVIRDLEAERLIEVLAHRGPIVAMLTPKLVREIYALRTEIEVLFLRSFVRIATDQDIAVLRAILQELSAAGARHDKTALVGIITRFLHHMAVVADNQVGTEIFDQLLARINMLRIMSMSTPGQIEASITAITGIVDRIAARDAGTAERALRRYTTSACESAIIELEKETGPSRSKGKAARSAG
jgi:GntR family transcriptional regulator, trigonelline degradation regulator